MTQHEHSTRHKEVWFWKSIVLVVLFLVHCDTSLQNATGVITKCKNYFITKCVTLFITKCNDFITNCGCYYKLRRLLQNALAQWMIVEKLNLNVFYWKMICMCVQEKTAIKDMNKKKIYSLMSYYVKFPLLYSIKQYEITFWRT